MRYGLILLPILLVGCKQGRQAAVSNDGRVASTVDSGTSVAGRGRIAEGGSAVEWSHDGQVLAFSTNRGTTLWPKGVTIPNLGGPYAWSLDDTSIAGVDDQNKVIVKNVQTGETRGVELNTGGFPSGLGWTSDGWTFGWNNSAIATESGKRIERKGATIYDAVPEPSSGIAWLEGAFESATTFDAALLSPLNLIRWSPETNAIASTQVGRFGALLSPVSPRRLSLPLTFALAPGGSTVAIGGIVIEAGSRTIDRLRVLADKKMTKTEEDEAERLLGAARAKAVVVKIEVGGPTTTLWSTPVALKGQERGIEDLAWSPNGKWLAVARRDGTVRVAAGG